MSEYTIIKIGKHFAIAAHDQAIMSFVSRRRAAALIADIVARETDASTKCTDQNPTQSDPIDVTHSHRR